MPSDAENEINSLWEALDRIVDHAFGPARTAIASEIARRSELLGDAIAFFALLQEAESGIFGGSPLLAITAFVKAIAMLDKLHDPTGYAVDRFLRHFKWVLEEALQVAEIPRPRIDELIEDYKNRAMAFGSSGRECLLIRRTWAMHRREKKEVESIQSELLRTRRDPLEDCEACEIDRWSRWQIVLGNHREAFKAANRILNQKKNCSEVPGRTYAGFLEACIATGDRKLGDQFHKKGLRLCDSNPYYLGQIGQHLTYLVLTERFAEAYKLMSRHLDVAIKAESTEAAFWFWRGCVRLLTAKPSSMAKIATDEATQKQLEAAKALDQRNGNSAYSNLIE